MLGVTSYQEALRALGGLLDRERRPASAAPPTSGVGVSGGTSVEDGPLAAALPGWLRVAEDPARAALEVELEGERRRLDASQLESLVLSSRALRGLGSAVSGPLSDLLRAVGYALDELRALAVTVEIRTDAMAVRFHPRDVWGPERSLSYVGEELAVLRRVASARRKGDPLRRVLILHADGAASAPLRELLVAEFAVEDLPAMYAPAVAQAGEAPHLVLVHLADDENCARGLEAVRVLRGSTHTAGVPLVLVAGAACGVAPDEAFAAGAHDFLREPVAPAILRARLRTWMLRGSGEVASASEPPPEARPDRDRAA